MLPRPLALTLSFVAPLALVACHSHTGIEPVYEGCATDENWETFDDYESTNRVKTDANAGPKWLEPLATGAELSVASSMSPTWRWQPSASETGTDKGNVSCAGFTATSLKTTSQRLSPLHQPPISGTVFDVQFLVEGAVVYRVLTTKQTVTVPQATWAGWTGKHLSVDLVSAKLLQNDVVEGPYRAPLQKVQVTP